VGVALQQSGGRRAQRPGRAVLHFLFSWSYHHSTSLNSRAEARLMLFEKRAGRRSVPNHFECAEVFAPCPFRYFGVCGEQTWSRLPNVTHFENLTPESPPPPFNVNKSDRQVFLGDFFHEFDESMPVFHYPNP
jgi:hypothetical protein